MSNSSDKKPRSKRSSFNADLDAMLDEAEQSLTYMPELLDEDAIDRLLVDDGFDMENVSDHGKTEPVIDELGFEPEDMEASINLQPGRTRKRRKPVLGETADALDRKLDELITEIDVEDDLVAEDVIAAPENDENVWDSDVLSEFEIMEEPASLVEDIDLNGTLHEQIQEQETFDHAVDEAADLEPMLPETLDQQSLFEDVNGDNALELPEQAIDNTGDLAGDELAIEDAFAETENIVDNDGDDAHVELLADTLQQSEESNSVFEDADAFPDDDIDEDNAAEASVIDDFALSDDEYADTDTSEIDMLDTDDEIVTNVNADDANDDQTEIEDVLLVMDDIELNSVEAVDDEPESVIAEFDANIVDEELITDEETGLAEQIAADLLTDNDFSVEDLNLSADEPVDEFADLDELQVIDEETLNTEIQPVDEFADDDALVAETIADEFADDIEADNATDVEADKPEMDDDFLMADFDISDDEGNETDVNGLDSINAADENLGDMSDDVDFDIEPFVQEEATPVSTASTEMAQAVAGLAALSEFKSEQEKFNNQQKKLIAELENKSRKSAIFAYSALGFGVIALGLAAYLGVVAHGAKSEAGKLQETIAGLEKKLVLPAPVLPQDNAGNEALATHHETSASSHTEPVKASDESGHDQTGAHEKTDAHQDESHSSAEHEPVKHADTVKHTTEKTEKPDAQHVDENEKQDVAPITLKKKPWQEETQHVEKEKIKPVAKQEAAVKSEPSSKARPKIKKKPEPEQKAASNDREPQKEKTKPAQKITTGGDWAVNLASFRQDWYARGKANELRKKGVPVDVVTVNIDNVTWYRLRVGGFSDKADATAYAGRVKKSLNLGSVWVGK